MHRAVSVLKIFLSRIVLWLFPQGLNVNIADIGYGVHNPGHGVHPGLAFCIETITTFVLVATVLSVAVEPKGPKALIPLCIGMAVCTGILAT